MNRMCRKFLPSWLRRQWDVAELLRHAKIVTDPETLAYLKAEAGKRREAATDQASWVLAKIR
jgi:hypothetical protein